MIFFKFTIAVFLNWMTMVVHGHLKISYYLSCNGERKQCHIPEPEVHGCKAYPVGELVFSEGEAGASSKLRNEYAAKHAFDPDSQPWIAGGAPPHFLWYDFKNLGHLHCPIKISFLPRQDAPLLPDSQHIPQQFQLIGTNDEECNVKSNWEVLCEAEYQDQEHPSSLAESRGCEVKRPCTKFRCIGIKVLKFGGEGKPGQMVALDQVRMWVE